MTQRLALGITVGAYRSAVAATAADDRDGESARVTAHPSVLRLTADAAPAFGTAAKPGGRHAGDTVLEGFLARVGDPVAMLAEDGSEHVAEDLVATSVACLIEEAAGYSDPVTVACHPAWWSRHMVEAQRDALARAGLDDVTLVPEPAAVLRLLDTVHTPREDGAVVVYDLGATGLTVSVLRTGTQSGMLAAPVRSTEVAGAEFDLLTMRYVLANAMGENDFDPFDPVVERELSALRERCRKAKEVLSRDTATVVEVRLDPAAGPQRIRLVRGEVEDLLRAPLLTSAELVRDALHRAGVELGDVRRIVLTGGGGAIPLVTEVLSSEFGLPVAAAGDPENAAALGAALLAADLAGSTVQNTPAVAADDTETTAIPALLPDLPDPPQPRGRFTGRQRAGIVAGAVTALALLATGTLALGTGTFGGGDATAPSTVHSPAEAVGVPATEAPAPGAIPVDATGQPVTAAPGTVPNNGNPAAPGTAANGGSPAPGTPAAPDGRPTQQAGSPAPAQPAPQQAPAQNNGGAPQPPANSGGGAPPQTVVIQPPTVPSVSVPTGVLSDTVDGLGDAVGGAGDAVGGVVGGVGDVLGGSGG
ncbi:Hsp70 family protein [Nocardia harenae]|uniref:Hsp70 family protein n=1 Tax=Nocardia harenae TaxID=358707 RepID=UPI0008343A2F|nr:Hsp70 family protein [Nocardia harenae]